MKQKNPGRKGLWLLLLGASMLVSITVISQNQEDGKQKRKERIEAFKIAFLTRKMGLTSEESQKFWPVYNDFDKKLKELENSVATLKDFNEKKIEGMSDKAVEDALKLFLDNAQKNLDLRKKYHEELKKILPVKKVALYYLAERDFKKELVKMAIEKKEQKGK